MDRVFPDGATEAGLTELLPSAPGAADHARTRSAGERRLVWTTFMPSQVDLDVDHPAALAYIDRIVASAHARRACEVVRLDAVGYAIKTPGTDSFMTEHTLAFVERLTARIREGGPPRARRGARALRAAAGDRPARRPGLRLRAARAAAARAGRRAMSSPSRAGSTSGRATPSRCSTPTTASASSTPARSPGDPVFSPKTTCARSSRVRRRRPAAIRTWRPSPRSGRACRIRSTRRSRAW